VYLAGKYCCTILYIYENAIKYKSRTTITPDVRGSGHDETAVRSAAHSGQARHRDHHVRDPAQGAGLR